MADTLHFVDLDGNYLGGFGTGAVPDVPAIEVDPPPHGSCVWTPEEGWVWPDDRLAASIRARRDALLVASDWTQTPDATVDRAAWAAYRKALRDITGQPGFPQAVEWPEEPGEPDPRAVMQSLTRRQLFIALHRLGLISPEEAIGAVSGQIPVAIGAAISTLPEAAQVEALITFAGFSEANRLDPLVQLIGATAGLTDEQIDAIWKEYSLV